MKEEKETTVSMCQEKVKWHNFMTTIYEPKFDILMDCSIVDTSISIVKESFRFLYAYKFIKDIIKLKIIIFESIEGTILRFFW